MKPGHPIREDIAREVRALLLARRGVDRAITGEQLAAEVARRLDLVDWLSPKTLLRRCQEAVARLVAEGERIASTSADGYFVATTQEEIEAGARDLRQRLIATAQRLRAYDAACADRILAMLGQEQLVEAPRHRKPKRQLVSVGQLQLGGLA